MIYPKNFESKIGFDEIRRLLKEHCLSTLGKERVDELGFSEQAATVNEWLEQVREFRRLQQATEKPELNFFFDVRESVARIRLGEYAFGRGGTVGPASFFGDHRRRR